jgi:hypothetical protein
LVFEIIERLNAQNFRKAVIFAGYPFRRGANKLNVFERSTFRLRVPYHFVGNIDTHHFTRLFGHDARGPAVSTPKFQDSVFRRQPHSSKGFVGDDLVSVLKVPRPGFCAQIEPMSKHNLFRLTGQPREKDLQLYA